MSEDRIEEVKKIGDEEGLTSSEGAPPERVDGVANREHFESLMMQKDQQQQQDSKRTVSTQVIDPAKKHPSLMDQVAELSKKSESVKKVQPTEVVAQAQEVINQIAQIKDQLAQPDQAIKPAYKSILNNKLTHINENIRIALSAVGVENMPAAGTQPVNGKNPIDRFLGFLTDGQAQLDTVAKEVHSLGNNKNGFNAAAMLAVQIKVGYIQHELEFFSSVLNKALESTKTIMNVQV